MAVVKQYDGVFGKIPHRVQIKCSGATGIFSITLPTEAHGSVGENVEASTLQEVQAKYKAASLQYKADSTKKEKVLIVKFADNLSCENTLSFRLECGVFEKVTWPGVSESERYEEIDSTIPDAAMFFGSLWPGDVEQNCLVFTWTAEKEHFLAKMCEAFITLIAKMREFTKTKKNLLSLMNSQKALPGWSTDSSPPR